MSKSKENEFVYESMVNNSDLTEIIDQIINGLKNKNISLKAGPKQIELFVNDNVELILRVKVKENKACKFILRMEWALKNSSLKNKLEIGVKNA